MSRPNVALADFMPTPDNIGIVRDKFRNLSEHPDFVAQYRDRLDACNLVFFAYDASLFSGPKDRDTFHSSFNTFRRAVLDPQERALIELRIRRAVFDNVGLPHPLELDNIIEFAMQAALLDQLTGSTTLVTSLPGAAEPGTPALEEYVKAYAYFPTTILNEIEVENHPNTIPDLIQLIVRELGVPTLRQFERIVKHLWKGAKGSAHTPPRPLPIVDGIPEPIPYNSSRYLFYGRKMHTREEELQRYGMISGGDNETGDPDRDSGVSWPSQATLSSTPPLNRA